MEVHRERQRQRSLHPIELLAQITYTTPDFGGFKFSIGVFDPIEPMLQGVPAPEGSPGVHAKVAYKTGPIYVSATYIMQKHEGETNAADFDSSGFDIGNS